MKHPAQEPDVIHGRAVTAIGAGVIVATVAGVIVAMLIERGRIHELHVASTPPPPFTGDINAMETRPYTVEAQGLDQHTRDEAVLGSYGWIDRAHGVVHIPIEAAFELYLQKRVKR